MPPRISRQTKFIFVTGGVVSSPGKGLTAAALGQLLISRGLSVTMQNPNGQDAPIVCQVLTRSFS